LKLNSVVNVCTVRKTVVVSVVLPDVPVTVMLYVPATVDEATVILIVEGPAPVIGAELNIMVTPVGWPVADRAIGESKPPEAVIVIVDAPLLPGTTDTEVGKAEMVK
jgi:hypothetical protein